MNSDIGPKTSSLPGVSLIIPSRNRERLLQETVESVLRGNRVPAELVIIDQSDQSHPILSHITPDRPCQLRYFWPEPPGASRARNAGIAAAKYKILVFLDDDMIVTPDWLESIVQALLQAGTKAVVTGRMLAAPAEQAGGFTPATKVEEFPACYKGRIQKDVLVTGNMAMYLSAVEEIGYFDERLGPGTPFPAAEDSDFGFRLLEAGYQICYKPQALLYHRAWRTGNDYLTLRWRYGVGRGAFYAKHFVPSGYFTLHRMLSDLWRHAIQIPRDLWGQRFHAYGDVVLSLGILTGAARWLLTVRGE